MAINLGGLERRAKSAINDVTNATTTLIDNTVQDVDFILRRVGDCARAVDSIRVRVANRAIQYQTTAMRILIQNQVLPVETIDQVFRRIARQIQRDPNPRVFHYRNPEAAIWLRTQRPDVVQINPNTHNFPANRWPYIFIHGAGRGGTAEEARFFYEDFEINARMFNPVFANSPNYRANADIYLVAYDAQIEGEDELIIRRALATVLGQAITGSSPDLFLAVMWKEFERRAIVTADRALLPMFNRMAGQTFRNAGLITHSLGCLVGAQAAERFIRAQPNANVLTFWYCMAAALPSDAFTTTGAFNNAPRIAGVADGIRQGTSVWFSYLDAVLLFAYTLANKHLALGVTGALESKNPLTDFNVTDIVGPVHDLNIADPSRGYFNLLASEIQRALFTGSIRSAAGVGRIVAKRPSKRIAAKRPVKRSKAPKGIATRKTVIKRGKKHSAIWSPQEE
ncbi:hypothetical protein [Paenibacillus methanolicus]|uniref:Uncharacterized protein n=1 Tax=Paenibacillus methanolicus TaxID=582686 RepID=A0A5S5CHZ8_9BACL|nr:hypothetical protein [Paenibacillus methanolicus]TYP78238.1 hypothetical protein BCM02_102815 [Paenibacillus methanolicus]